MNIKIGNEHPEITHIMDKFWANEQKAYDKLLTLKDQSPEEIYGENWQKAFSKQPKTVVCIDERVNSYDPNEPKIGIAGTLVLMSDEDLKITLQKLQEAGVDKITYHEGCGAVGLYKKNNPEDDRESKEIAQNMAQNVCFGLSLNSVAQCVGYSDEADIQMMGDPRFHNARAIVVDGTGKFNPALLEIPAHFLLSAFYEPNLEYTNHELEIALDIALGNHGFGTERFTKEPIAIILVGGENNYSLKKLEESFSKTFEKYKNFISVIKLQKSV